MEWLFERFGDRVDRIIDSKLSIIDTKLEKLDSYITTVKDELTTDISQLLLKEQQTFVKSSNYQSNETGSKQDTSKHSSSVKSVKSVESSSEKSYLTNMECMYEIGDSIWFHANSSSKYPAVIQDVI